MNRLLRPLLVLLLVLAPAGFLSAEKVADLPKPTSYVSDFAGVLDPTTKQQVEELCLAVDRQAHAQIAVITIKTLDDDQTIEEFSTELEEKWKVGNKSAQGILLVIVLNPRKDRIEVGYGLEGILNDAKVGGIRDAMKPALHVNDYNQGVTIGVQELSKVIAADVGVTLQPITPRHTYRRVDAAPQPIGIGQIIIGIGFILLIIFLASTGNLGWLWILLNVLMSGGGRGGGGGWGGGGGGGGDDDRGGGFGGFGGGSSGGGGASGDY